MPEKNQTKSKNSNGRGGARPNAGRKAGSATKRTREIADKAMAEGVSPLEFMLAIMRAEPGDIDDARLLADHQAMRFEAAKAAAPYIHPRLSSVEMDAKVTTRTLAEELAELNAQRNAKDNTGVA
jgi:hypothetical protein